MTGGRQRSIAKVRTFGEDVSRARGSSGRDTTTPIVHTPPPVPPPTAPVSPSPVAVPPVPERAATVPEVAPHVPTNTPSIPPPVPDVTELTKLSATIGGNVTPFASSADAALPAFSAEGDVYTEGTIISDKKRNRFKLFPAIGQAIGGWASDTKEALATKPSEPSIRTVETRLETLKAAAKVSSLAPRDDHGLVVKRLTETARAPVVPTANIKAATAVPPPQWKHQAAAEETDAAASETAPREGPIESQRRVTVTTPAPAPVAQAVHTPLVAPAPAPARPPIVAPAQAATPEPQQAKPVPPARTPVPVRAVVLPAPLPAPSVAEQPVRTPYPTAVPRAPQKARLRSVVVVGSVIIGMSLLGAGAGVLWYLKQAPTLAEPTTPAMSTLVSGAATVTVPLGTTREALLTTLDQERARATTLTTFSFRVTDTPAPLVTTLTNLSWRAPGSFLRSIREMTIGSTETREPFIVMKSTDFNTGFAGMLAWEAAISSDLAPLFGTPVTESFDPTARTDTQLRSAFFRDEVVGNVSVRTLVDAQNTDRLMYGFITPSIILIAPNRDSFRRLQSSINETP